MSVTTQLSRKDWLDEALRALETEGIGGVRILRLATRLGVTRGSFYWHFENRDELLHALLEHWVELSTQSAVTHDVDFEGNAEEHLRELARFIVQPD